MKKSTGPLTTIGLPVLLLTILLVAAIQIHKLSRRTSDLEQQKNQLNGEKDGLAGELFEQRTENADLAIEVGDLNSRLKQSVRLNRAFENEVASLNSRIQTLSGQLDESLTRESQLTAELTAMTTLKGQMEEKVFSLESDVTVQETRISQLTTRISELQYSLAEARERSSILTANNDSLVGEVSVMKQRLDTAVRQNNLHKETINALTEEGSTLVKHTEKLNDQLASMTSRFDELSAEAENQTAIIQLVSSERDTFKDEAAGLSKLATTRENEIKALAADYGVLNENFETVKINNTNLTKAYEELVAEAKYNEEIQETLEGDLMEQAEKTENLRATVAVLESRLKESQSRMNIVAAENVEHADQLAKLKEMLDESDRMKAALTSTVSNLETQLVETRTSYGSATARLEERGLEVEEIQTRMSEATAEISAQQTLIDEYHAKLDRMEAISVDCVRLMADEDGEQGELTEKIDKLEQELLVIKEQARRGSVDVGDVAP